MRDCVGNGRWGVSGGEGRSGRPFPGGGITESRDGIVIVAIGCGVEKGRSYGSGEWFGLIDV